MKEYKTGKGMAIVWLNCHNWESKGVLTNVIEVNKLYDEEEEIY